ncbi:MAG: AraC family ligand binding domain-containing protein [Colwellia sp.]|nr:AraC family ligand binding domain-containing protein [Colwellia sp.]MCW8863697.1 AraC family ligand binding domain-containing protein [Colwellia sp.]MCW9081336.1 AraC family ligand binding domain-containing protein [Colwellia sp.]
MNDLNKDFEKHEANLVDVSSKTPQTRNDQWTPLVITKETIDAEIERLASLPTPENGRRETLIVHPMARADIPTMAPGIQVRLSVLKPGESTAPFRHNATEVNFCIQGSGYTEIDGKKIAFGLHDVWNHPSYRIYTHHNDTDELQVRITYSNAPLLQFMDVYFAEGDAVEKKQEEAIEQAASDPRSVNPFGKIPVGDQGGHLVPYETLVNPECVESNPLLFKWNDVKGELDKLEALGQDYKGRRLYMLSNPATGRTNGITPNFFATITNRPGNIIDRPHRHVSASINYYFQGSGYSYVAGNKYEWKAGDLMFSAPGWAVHNHASNADVYELTIQDQPLNLLMESLLWQESMKKDAALLGAQQGFATNRAASK